MAVEKEIRNKSPRAEKEEKILNFWKENDIFQRTLDKESPKGTFVFYEGPPGANGLPHIGHFETRVFKDAIPRYKTMQGYKVPRKAGWDTHGLPVEIEAEKQLGIKSKKDIEELGIALFNKKCKEIVWKYVNEWKDLSDRMGFWLDFENAYVTYKNDYIETVWSIISHVNNENLLYKDYKVLPWCPRCGTALSSHELAQGYQDVKDLSVYAKFKIIEEEDTYFLAWTTTPWTLPGNIALAVGEDIDYVKVKIFGDHYILAESRLSVIAEEHEVVKKMKGKELVGIRYEPLYPYLKENLPDSEIEKLEKAYQVYSADFVNTEDGTGIVHTAVMYGIDDFELGTKLGLPKHHLVDETGHFKTEVTDFAGRFVKEEETAVEIIKNLAHRGLLFKKEKHEHSYPHCWRCKTPLIYYARDSWYIRMSELRSELVKENEKINWEPDYIKEGRFGEWLREVKDWAISRERYWGTPLPAWESLSGKRLVVGGIDDLKKHIKTRHNRYWVMRHGEGEHNILKTVNTSDRDLYHLTQKGKEQSRDSAKSLKSEDIDLIVASPFIRTKETASIVSDVLGLDESSIVYDERLKEVDAGDFDKKTEEELQGFFDSNDAYETAIPGGESFKDIKKRLGEALDDIEKSHEGKNILIITHRLCGWLIVAAAERMNKTEAEKLNIYIENGEIIKLNPNFLPHNEYYELDLHRPYIDDVILEKDGEVYKRVKEVLDVWLDSGAMPFAQDPKNILYPADYISEAIDQTRGWFYTLHAVGILMGKGRAFKNVICLGHILDKDGKKMSKSIGNVVSPNEMMNKYGVDVLRMWMYSINQPGESKMFDERTVEEVNRRVFNLLDNVYAFYDLYRSKEDESNKYPKSKNPLDIWILSKFNSLVEYSTEKIDNYKLLEPTRAMREFLDDLSTWYVRRSRERLKEGDKDAAQTLYFVLKNISKILAPFAPFAAEDLYQNLRIDGDPISVHMEEWPHIGKIHKDVIENMERTRMLVSQGLEARARANIKVRQPLSALYAKDINKTYEILVKDEVNVMELIEAEDLKLDTDLTPELIEKGKIRDIIRSIQEIRKEKGLNPKDIMEFSIPGEDKDLYEKYSEEIQKTTGVKFI